MESGRECGAYAETHVVDEAATLLSVGLLGGLDGTLSGGASPFGCPCLDRRLLEQYDDIGGSAKRKGTSHVCIV